MPDQLIIEHCSPTLAGLKTGNLFSVRIKGKENSYREIRSLNKILTKYGLRAIPVRCTEEFALIYLYRPEFLSRDLSDPEAVEILEQMGYASGRPEQCIVKLVRRLQESGAFPHEIGLFLGYPPTDVKGFMTSPTQGVKCTGFWKVYGDLDAALRTFSRYRKCTEAYRKEIGRGKSLEQLIVRIPACPRTADESGAGQNSRRIPDKIAS
ncbi:MAG: DUF3793 family protein [Eubacterium sp.]|nr:DUF3793 family protein [Eubacterium sp.]